MSKAMPLVMIHGLFGSQSFYAPNRRIAGVDVHTPDLIGYRALGDSAVEPITLAGQVAHVIRYMQERVGAPSVLLGHSVGGAVAMLVAASAPDLVCGVINVAKEISRSTTHSGVGKSPVWTPPRGRQSTRASSPIRRAG
ncbi:alpha/beta fold hydrolase [Paraburkholderia kirstenboschensis]|uniref:Alpha/beta hydrolase n=1 Tax=Paraburkholderia kirstenboschensis TaxID=1245436 RepID=A0ABZ0ES09_9BURK|nr:alpha/beta hydrolase [Paraburkholderia kirstenboschensis]WOD19953.1 alpha/beta hydrolase [Paraburkholderia kirstenboschensis]